MISFPKFFKRQRAKTCFSFFFLISQPRIPTMSPSISHTTHTHTQHLTFEKRSVAFHSGNRNIMERLYSWLTIRKETGWKMKVWTKIYPSAYSNTIKYYRTPGFWGPWYFKKYCLSKQLVCFLRERMSGMKTDRDKNDN